MNKIYSQNIYLYFIKTKLILKNFVNLLANIKKICYA